MNATPASEPTAATPPGLRLEATDHPDSPLLPVYFEGYDQSFVLAAEKESLEGFRDCLVLNHGSAQRDLFERYGPFQELVAVAREPRSEAIVGGANFNCFEFHVGGPLQGPRVRTVALNYVHVLPSFRGRGYSREILRGCQQLAASVLDRLGGHPSEQVPIVFIEQNDPLRLAPEAYALDTAHSGIDQIDRIAVWARMGARLLDFDYVQPALAPDGDAEAGLLLSVIDAPGATLATGVLLGHLERFFAISCLKGRPLESEPNALDQIERLRRMSDRDAVLDLLDAVGWLDQVRSNRIRPEPRPDGLLGALKSRGTLTATVPGR